MDIVLTPPISLEWELAANTIVDEHDHPEAKGSYQAPNLLQRLFSLFKNVRPGTDITKFELPPTFNVPKSQLQMYGETVYAVNKDMLRECANGRSPVDRMIAVVAWNLSAFRPLIFGVSPYNSILGETHHVSRGSLHVLLEQVSHHPPVCALQATDANSNVEVVWCQETAPKFYGATIEAEVRGQRRVKLLSRNETYILNSPKLLIRLLPLPGINWVGKLQIKCQETNLEAELHYGKGSSFFGTNSSSRSIKGKIMDASTSNRTTLYEIEGRWDKTVTFKDVSNGNIKVIYDAKEVVSGLETPTVKDHENVMPTESTAVWAEVSKGILNKNWDRAKDAKRRIEERERELVRQRNARGKIWSPKNFAVSYSKEFGWDCNPICNSVPPAPILFPT